MDTILIIFDFFFRVPPFLHENFLFLLLYSHFPADLLSRCVYMKVAFHLSWLRKIDTTQMTDYYMLKKFTYDPSL